MAAIDPLTAGGVLLATAATDAVYVMFTSAVVALRKRWSDPLLTALTVLLVVMLFVMAPLQAMGIFVFQAFEFVFAIILIAGVFVMSGSRTAVAAMAVALLMAARLRQYLASRHHPSSILISSPARG